jgi:hypothetical protein
MISDKAPKLDIFRVLKALDEKDVNFFNKLTETEKKAFQPFLVMRWMSGTFDARQVYFINELVNPFVFSLASHKELLWDLLVVCNSGKSRKYTWNKLLAGASSKPVSTRVVAQHFKYSLKDAGEAVLVLTKNDILDLAADLGIQPDEISKIKKEWVDDKSEWTDPSKVVKPIDNGIFEF